LFARGVLQREATVIGSVGRFAQAGSPEAEGAPAKRAWLRTEWCCVAHMQIAAEGAGRDLALLRASAEPGLLRCIERRDKVSPATTAAAVRACAFLPPTQGFRQTPCGHARSGHVRTSTRSRLSRSFIGSPVIAENTRAFTDQCGRECVHQRVGLVCLECVPGTGRFVQ
jgi:hypothetical protein